MKNSFVSRHDGAVRLTHWAVAISGLVLIFSGFGTMPLYGRFYVNELPGLSWSTNFLIQQVIHYMAAMIFTAAVFFHLVFHLRRREFAAVPRKGDVKESIEIIKAMVTDQEEPPNGKFLAEQRLAYAAMGLTSLLLITTGLIKVYKNTGVITLDPTFLQVVTLTHTLATMAFLGLFVAHLGAFLIKANRPLLPSMFTGKVRRDYAEHRHREWDI
ncbi:cytochrome b/b6 domain-containing protein [Desulfuromonas sp. KJ2020]|uniref:formate dehydrogenase subunit gamma n=1 Tax=Desulfuromonas sp. KJ2020 TaxID=2919173 RepID=UPI0020A71A60|nr:cytochrome b/b6 domain-containing protein [Desulfuromonas sp. KJ2020]MCP3176821.1 cytochrome b/b6 domain-containing protein [Desulfuromonas sp. KJ2020]